MTIIRRTIRFINTSIHIIFLWKRTSIVVQLYILLYSPMLLQNVFTNTPFRGKFFFWTHLQIATRPLTIFLSAHSCHSKSEKNRANFALVDGILNFLPARKRKRDEKSTLACKRIPGRDERSAHTSEEDFKARILTRSGGLMRAKVRHPPLSNPRFF